MPNLTQAEAERMAEDVAELYVINRGQLHMVAGYLIDLAHAVNERDPIGGASVLAVFAREVAQREAVCALAEAAR